MKRTPAVDEDEVVLAKNAVGSGPMGQSSIFYGM